MKKCKKCGAPLEGFLYNTIGKLLGVKPSANDPEVCNKCEEIKTEAPEVKPIQPTPTEPEAPDKTADKEDTAL
jgi:hypothetical protein